MSDRRIRVIRHGGGDERQIVGALDERTIRILVAPDRSTSWAHQMLLITIVDLLGRVFPRIDVIGADVAASPDLPPGADALADRLHEARRHGCGAQPALEPNITLRVGAGAPDADIHVDGSGWQAYVGRDPSRLPYQESLVCLGALSAACRGAAHAFELVLGDLLEPREVPMSAYWSGLSFNVSADPIEEADPDFEPHLEAVLVGGGSIGGAAAYFFAHVPRLSGALAIVDPERLEGHNLDRALLATADRTAREEVKANVAVDALAHLGPRLTTEGHQKTISEYYASRSREEPLPLVLSAVDSTASRRATQDCLPLSLINAACSPAEVMISGHRTGAGPCVCCLHMSDLLDGDQVLARLIEKATGLSRPTIIVLLLTNGALDEMQLRGIEAHAGFQPGALATHAGATLRQLWRERLLYGARAVTTAQGGEVAVAAPWVTALAGFLLGGEALKAGPDQLESYRLGPESAIKADKYVENVYASPDFRQLTRPPRWAGSECLCRSPRRLRIISDRYGVPLRSDDPLSLQETART